MEKNQPVTNADKADKNLNANNAYSGSGSMQPGGSIGEAGKLSDYPEGNLDDALLQNDALAGNPIDHQPEGRTIDEATDPSKLSDI